MSILPPGWVPFVVTALTLVVPTVIAQVRSAARAKADNDDAPLARSRLRPLLSWLIVLNMLYTAYNFFVHPPKNIFDALRVPFTIPAPKLRAILVQHTLPPRETLPLPLENLLTRMASFEVRTFYVRFGHDTIQGCEYCQGFWDFALFALPAMLLDYALNMSLYGLITMRGTGRERLRILGTGILISAAVLEAYYLCTADVKVPRDGFRVNMLYDNVYTLRKLLFMIIQPIVHNLPTSPAPNTSSIYALQPAAAVLDKAVTKIRVLDYVHGAVLREPTLRRNTGEWWARQGQESQWVREDATMLVESERLGRGISRGEDVASGVVGDGSLMSDVKKLVQNLLQVAWGARMAGGGRDAAARTNESGGNRTVSSRT